VNYHLTIEFSSLFLAGVLAGEEFVVRFGIRGPLATLDDGPHIQLRQALVLTLRVLVPAIYVPTLLAGVAVLVLGGADAGLPFRCAGVGALIIWILVTLFGTVPINAAALDWKPDAPPSDWKQQVDRWEQLNTVRTCAALLAFAFLLAAVALRLG
jgi:uncharacterized membrane protein